VANQMCSCSCSSLGNRELQGWVIKLVAWTTAFIAPNQRNVSYRRRDRCRDNPEFEAIGLFYAQDICRSRNKYVHAAKQWQIFLVCLVTRWKSQSIFSTCRYETKSILFVTPIAANINVGV